jgi:hypothetical protein
MAMMATTTSSSMRVKASREDVRVKFEGFMARIRKMVSIQLLENTAGNGKRIGLKRFTQSWHSTGRYLPIPEATFCAWSSHCDHVAAVPRVVLFLCVGDGLGGRPMDSGDGVSLVSTGVAQWFCVGLAGVEVFDTVP